MRRSFFKETIGKVKRDAGTVMKRNTEIVVNMYLTGTHLTRMIKCLKFCIYNTHTSCILRNTRFSQRDGFIANRAIVLTYVIFWRGRVEVYSKLGYQSSSLRNTRCFIVYTKVLSILVLFQLSEYHLFLFEHLFTYSI